MSKEIANELALKGFAGFRFEDSSWIEELKLALLKIAKEYAGSSIDGLSEVHHSVSNDQINELRVLAIRALNHDSYFHQKIIQQASTIMESLLGPDLAVQKSINLVISAPQDQTSQIPLHADTWVGHSRFELNLWIPLTQSRGTQSMYLLPLEAWAKASDIDITKKTVRDLLSKWKNDLHCVEMEPGSALIFWHGLPHGNLVNKEKKTRWAINIRFKNLFSPYGDRDLGEYFMPCNLGPLTKIVMRAEGIHF